MGLEVAAFISDLVPANPPGTDAILQGDDHFRLLKTVLTDTFPNADKAFYFPDGLSKSANHTILAAEMHKFFDCDATAGAFNMTLPTLAASDDGWSCTIIKIDSSANDVTVVGTINGVANILLETRWQSIHVWWTGTAWRSFVGAIVTNQLTALTDPAVGDLLPIYDVSAGADFKITLENMLKVVNVLTAETAPAADDLMLLFDTSATAVRKMTPVNFFKSINLLTEDTVAPVVGDFYSFFDTSTGLADKIDAKFVSPFSLQLIHVRDEKASGTDGGTFTSGAFQTRTLNTVKTNEVSGASLAANQLTLPAGSYILQARAPASIVGLNVTRWQNITDGSTTLVGSSNGATTESQNNIDSVVQGKFTIAGAKAFELQHRGTTSRATDGFGAAHGFQTEVYADVMVWKVA